MATGNANRIALLAQLEVTPGAGITPPSFVHATDAILLYENKTPITPEFEEIQILPIRGSLHPASSAIGRGLYRMTPVSMLQRAENIAGGPLPARIGRLMQMCATQEDANATPDVIYRPISSGFKTGVVRWFPDGSQRDAYFVLGTFTIEASAGREQRISFDLQGVYNGEINNVAFPSDLVFEPTLATTWKGANVTITSGATINDAAGLLSMSGGTALTPDLVVKSMRFTAGVPVAEIRDANAANSIFGYDVSEVFNPRLELTVERDSNPNINFTTDWAAQTLHQVSLKMDDDRIEFFAPEAQVVGRTDAEDQGRSTMQLTYKLTDSVAGSGVGRAWQWRWVG